jgi:hypothetical protein
MSATKSDSDANIGVAAAATKVSKTIVGRTTHRLIVVIFSLKLSADWAGTSTTHRQAFCEFHVSVSTACGEQP